MTERQPKPQTTQPQTEAETMTPETVTRFICSLPDFPATDQNCETVESFVFAVFAIINLFTGA